MHYPHAVHRSNYFTTWRDGDWKVIYHALPEVKSSGGRFQSDDGHYELFLWKNDPYESNNLAASHPEELKRMMPGMIDELERMDAVYPVDEDGNDFKPQL